MSLFAKRIIIPDNYMPQSEIGDWLPVAKLIQEERDNNFIDFLVGVRKTRDNRLLINLFLLAFFLNLSSAVAAYSSNLFTNDKIGNLALLFIGVASIIILLAATIILFGDIYFSVFESNDEPNYRSAYKGKHSDAFDEVLNYWDAFLRSDSPIYASSGNNRIGVEKTIKFSEFGLLALLGSGRRQRGAIFTYKLWGLEKKWWFPSPDLSVELLEPQPKNNSIIEQIVFHENEDEVSDFLVRLSAVIMKEKTKKSRNARLRWIEIIKIVRKFRHISDIKKREAAVTKHMIDNHIDRDPPHPRIEISRYFTYRTAEKALLAYLSNSHLDKNPLAIHLRTQLTQ